VGIPVAFAPRERALLVLSFVGAFDALVLGWRSANSNLARTTRGQVYANSLSAFAGTSKFFLFGKTAWICLRRERGIVDEEKTRDTSHDDAH
jgi:hypothetical protein